jgi:hypothetical protein
LRKSENVNGAGVGAAGWNFVQFYFASFSNSCL